MAWTNFQAGLSCQYDVECGSIFMQLLVLLSLTFIYGMLSCTRQCLVVISQKLMPTLEGSNVFDAGADLTEQQWQSINSVLKAGIGPNASSKDLLQVCRLSINL